MGLSSSGDRIIVSRVILTQYQRVTDRQRDRQTGDVYMVVVNVSIYV